MNDMLIIYSLISTLIIILILPVLWKKVEENLEIFFLIMGIIASIISGSFGFNLLKSFFCKVP